jgi:rod shape-determining protein MreD
MNVALISLLTLMLLTLESVLVKVFAFEFVRIDVVLCLVVFAASRCSLVSGAVSAFLVGYLLDVFSGQPTWLEPAATMLIFVAIRLSAQSIEAKNRLGFALFVSGATVLHALIVSTFTWMTRTGPLPSLSYVPMQVLITALAGQLLWPLLGRIESGEIKDKPSPIKRVDP